MVDLIDESGAIKRVATATGLRMRSRSSNGFSGTTSIQRESIRSRWRSRRAGYRSSTR